MSITVRYFVLLVATVLAAVVFSGCGSFVKNSYKTLETTSATLTASATAFEKYDHDTQMDIVAAGKKAGKSKDAIQAELERYRNLRAPVLKAFTEAGAVVVAGRALLPLVEAGVKKETDIAAWLTQLLNAAEAVRQALSTFGLGGG